MMKVLGPVVNILCLLLAATMTNAFQVRPSLRRTSTSTTTSGLAMMVLPPPPQPAAIEQTTLQTATSSWQTTTSTTTTTTILQQGVHNYLTESSATSSITVALQDIKPVTAEEIAQKKFNFNLWFWGGGFVAPFLATIFYFGPKFWTK